MNKNKGLGGYFHFNDLGEVITFDGKLSDDELEKIREKFSVEIKETPDDSQSGDVITPDDSPNGKRLPYTKDIWGFFFDFPLYNIDTFGINKIFFNGIVEEGSMNSLIREVNQKTFEINALCAKLGLSEGSIPIEIYINSPGGSVSDGFRFIDFVGSLPIKVHTIVLGIAASMGFLLWLCGDKRYVSKNSDVLIHQLRSGMAGKRSDILDYLKHMEDVHMRILNYIVEKTGMSEKDVEKFLAKETWLTAQEVVDMGLGMMLK